MANWSTDADLVLAEPQVLACLPKERAALASGSDGATDSAGTSFSSAGVGSAFLTKGVLADMYLEITAGAYQASYRIATAAASALTLDRPIGASLTSLSFQVRSFANEHAEAHQHYLDAVLRRVGSAESGDSNDEVFDESEIADRSQRDLRDLCVARVLARVFRAAETSRECIWHLKAEYWSGREKELERCIENIEMDTDGDSIVDQVKQLWSSIEAGIS